MSTAQNWPAIPPVDFLMENHGVDFSTAFEFTREMADQGIFFRHPKYRADVGLHEAKYYAFDTMAIYRFGKPKK